MKGRVKNRRFRQMNLRTFLITAIVVSVAFGWYTVRAQKQEKLVQWIAENGGRVRYDFQYNPEINESTPKGTEAGPKWLVDRLGVDYFATVTQVVLRGPLRSGEQIDLGRLRHVPCIAIVDLPVNDLSPLSEFTNLQNVTLTGLPASDLTPLAKLATLKRIAIFDCDSVELEPLHQAKDLKELWIGNNSNANVDDIDRFEQAVPNCKVTRK